MKRKIFLLTAIILTFSMMLTACGQTEIGEAKAKQIALDNINKMFQTNQTEATVTHEQNGCNPDQVGAMATTGNAEDTTRWYYMVSVPLSDATSKYEAYVVASTGEVISLSQHDANIILTKDQEEQALQLYQDEKTWGEKHLDALSSLTDGCRDWAIKNLNDSHAIVLEANRGHYPEGPISTTFTNNYYVITNDAKVYFITMQWPSMQVLNIDLVNSK